MRPDVRPQGRRADQDGDDKESYDQEPSRVNLMTCGDLLEPGAHPGSPVADKAVTRTSSARHVYAKPESDI